MRDNIYKYVAANGGQIEQTDTGQRILRDEQNQIVGLPAGKAYHIEQRLTTISTFLNYIDLAEQTAYDYAHEAAQAYQQGYKAAQRPTTTAQNWRDRHTAADAMKDSYLIAATTDRILAGEEPTSIGFTLAKMDLHRKKAIHKKLQKENLRKITIANAKTKHNF